jgi:WD domain, G-beta repeat
VIRALRVPDADLQFTGLVAFGPDGNRLVTGLDNGQAVATFDLRAGGRGELMRTDVQWVADVSPDGRCLAFSNGGMGVALFDLAAGRFRVGWTFPAPARLGCGGGGIGPDSYSARFSPDGSYLLSWAERGVGVLWHPVTGEPERLIHTGLGAVSEFAFSPDGLWLAVATDGTVALWDVPTGKPLVGWESGHRDSITHLAFAGSGRLVTSSADLTALLWDLKPRKKLTRPAWEALASDDPVEAYRAVWALATDAGGAELLRSKIAPIKPASAGPVKHWIAGLAADRYALREEAASVLEELGRRIEPELRTARAETRCEEVRTRLDALLAKLPRDRNWEEVTHARAIAAMELAGTDAARKVLAEWAAGAPGARLTTDAKAALLRLGRAPWFDPPTNPHPQASR